MLNVEDFAHMQEALFKKNNGIFIPISRPSHRTDEYDEYGFDFLIRMQRDHFWYRGRNKLMLNVLRKESFRRFGDLHDLRAIDMGGGCGGWLDYLHGHEPGRFQQLALGDSSMRALSLAETVVGSFADRYQIDLLSLPWNDEWNIVFLFDVLEHIPDHAEVLRQIAKSMRPGGLLFVTAPALSCFWTSNDEMAHHQRRYCRKDFRALAAQTGLKLIRTDYFMFFLSPMLFLSRIMYRPPESATSKQIQEHMIRTHRIPPRPINDLLANILFLEALAINALHFPWGTSILSVFQKPAGT